MFDIGWTEMLVVAVVMILVVGPKDLPGMLRTIGKTVGDLRRMAGDFQRQFSDALKEADVDGVQKEIRKVTSFTNPLEDINKSADELMNSLELEDLSDLASDDVKVTADVVGVKPVGTPTKPRKTSKGDAILAKKIEAGKAAAKKPATNKPAAKKSIAKKPAAIKPVASKLAAKNPPTKKPPTKKPTTAKSPARKTATARGASKPPATKTTANRKAKIGGKSA